MLSLVIITKIEFLVSSVLSFRHYSGLILHISYPNFISLDAFDYFSLIASIVVIVILLL